MPSELLPDDLLWIEPVSPAFPHACNAWAIREEDGTWTWIDPGSAGEENLARTRSELERLELPLDRLGRILITHAHVDHFCAAAVLAREGVDVPVECHPDVAALAADLDRLVATFDLDIAVDRFPEDRERAAKAMARSREFIFHGPCPFHAVQASPTLEDGTVLETGGFRWTCHLTPGHAPGHLALHDPDRKVLVAGDVIGHSLAWHSPSSGGAAVYLESVERVARLEVDLLLPSHGPPTDDPANLVDKMRSRLIGRDDRILDCLAAGPLTFPELYDRAMGDDGRRRLFPYAPMLAGHLERLGALGQLEDESDVIRRR